MQSPCKRRGSAAEAIRAVALLSLCLAAPVAHAQVIVNGDFNAGLTGWTTNTGNIFVDAGNGNPGANAVINDVGTDPFNPTLSQTITGLTTGITYLITGDHAVHVEITPTANSFGAAIDGIFLYQDSLTPAQGYQPFSFVFTATGTSAVLSLVGERNGSDVSYRVDNIAIAVAPSAAAPEPGTIALLLGIVPAAAGMEALRRRQRRRV